MILKNFYKADKGVKRLFIISFANLYANLINSYFNALLYFRVVKKISSIMVVSFLK